MKNAKYIIFISILNLTCSLNVFGQIISSTTTQVNNPAVFPNGINQPILRVEIVMGNFPVTLTNMRFNSNGSTNPLTDLANCKLWHYNTPGPFTTSGATLQGVYMNPWAPNFEFLTAPNVNYAGPAFYNLITPGVNYFWVTADIKSGAIVCNLVDMVFLDYYADGIYFFPDTMDPVGYSVIGPCSTSINEPELFDQFQIFPNPAKNHFSIRYFNQSDKSLKFSIVDLAGKVDEVLYDRENTVSSQEFSSSHFSPGIYFIRAQSENRTIYKKLLIQ